MGVLKLLSKGLKVNLLEIITIILLTKISINLLTGIIVKLFFPIGWGLLKRLRLNYVGCAI